MPSHGIKVEYGVLSVQQYKLNRILFSSKINSEEYKTQMSHHFVKFTSEVE
jgi:hypothetical protein